MKLALATTSLVCLIAVSPASAEYKPFDNHPSPAPAANATATGTGIANSSSQSGAVAISGQGGQGGKGGNSNSSLTINNPANTTSNVNQTLSGTTTQNVNSNQRLDQNVSGTTTVKNVPSMVAPGLSAAGLETCLGSASGGASVVGFGATFGTTVPDPGCNARLDARTLWSMGLKSAAVARLCIREDIYRSMPDICARYMPVAAVEAAGYVAPRAQPISVYMSESAYTGGNIMLIDGKSGRERLCGNYDNAKFKCRQWADAQPMKRAHIVKPKTAVAAVNQAAEGSKPSTNAAAAAVATEHKN